MVNLSEHDAFFAESVAMAWENDLNEKQKRVLFNECKGAPLVAIQRIRGWWKTDDAYGPGFLVPGERNQHNGEIIFCGYFVEADSFEADTIL